MHPINKANLPAKICVVCKRPFTWRKKWSKVWDEVKYCSEKCRMNKTNKKFKMIISTNLSPADIDRIIEMAWEDRTTFEAIEMHFGLKQQDVIKLMRKELKLSSFKLWRERTTGRSTKHELLRDRDIDRFKCSRQRSITHNKISKR